MESKEDRLFESPLLQQRGTANRRSRLDFLQTSSSFNSSWFFPNGQTIFALHTMASTLIILLSRFAPGLEHRQGTRQAVHAGAAPKGRNTSSAGARHRRGLDPQGAHLPHREGPDVLIGWYPGTWRVLVSGQRLAGVWSGLVGAIASGRKNFFDARAQGSSAIDLKPDEWWSE
jgi:hypothetical protein